MEETLYEIASLRTFAKLDLNAHPDETTILNFRHMLEQIDLAEDIFKQVNAHLARKGLLLKKGSIVDATIIASPSPPECSKPNPEQAETGGDLRHPGMTIDAEMATGGSGLESTYCISLSKDNTRLTAAS